MKKFYFIVLMLLTMHAVSAQKKTAKPAPIKAKPAITKTVSVYKDVMMGDQRNTKYGQFFIAKTGKVVDLDAAKEMPEDASLVFFREYGDNVLLTFPGNAREASAFKSEYAENPLFSESTGGVDAWEQGLVMTGDIVASDLKTDQFNEITQNLTWKSFSQNFIVANGGTNKVGGISYVTPDNGKVYLIRLNNTLRALLLVKSVIRSGTKSGSIKFDIIVEKTIGEK
ncbi:MAG: hypothetical protein ACK5NK_12330 [Niabella sp.]